MTMAAGRHVLIRKPLPDLVPRQSRGQLWFGLAWRVVFCVITGCLITSVLSVLLLT